MNDHFTPKESATLRELYEAGVPTVELAERLGRSKAAIWNHASRLGFTRPPVVYTSTPELLLALRLAERPEGVGSADLSGDRDEASKRLAAWTSKGKLHRAVLGRRTVRFFTTPEAAAAYVKANLPTHIARTTKAAHKARKGWGPGDPWHITPATIYTYAPPPPARVYRTNTHAPL